MRFFVSLMIIGLVGSVIFVVALELIFGGGEAAQQSNPTQKPVNKELSGKVAGSHPDRGTFAIKTEPAPQREVAIFRYRPDSVRVTLDGKEAEPDAISGGQKVRVEYVTKTTKKNREINLADSIKLKSGAGAEHGGESTG